MRRVMLLSLVSMIIGACSQNPSVNTDPVGEMTTPDGEAVGRATIWNEAPLPKGFPPPGPIGEIVIKSYPAYRMAVKTADGPRGQNELFSPLFNHIKKEEIAMTAPVEMTYGADDERRIKAMAFMYRTPDMGRLGDADGGVVVKDVPAQQVLSIGVRGSYSDAAFEAAYGKLQDWFKQNPGRFKAVGPPRYLGYNSPFILPFMKYGEVQIPIVPQH